MPVNSRKKTDRNVRKVIELLQSRYGADHPGAVIEAYRYNPSSIRIRIIDSDFRGLGRIERDNIVWPILESLPEDIRSDITALLLVTPEEKPDSLMNQEFDDPSPSRL